MNENMKDIIDRMAKAEAELAVIHYRIRRLDARMNDEEMHDIEMERDYGAKNPFVLKSDIEIGYIRELFGLTRSDAVTAELAKLNAGRAKKEEEA